MAMNINPMKLLQVKGLWNKFQKNHPKFPQFIKAVGKNALQEGSVIEINVTTADGRTMSSNLKINAEDMDLLRQIQELTASV